MSHYRKKPVVVEAVRYAKDMSFAQRKEMLDMFKGSHCGMEIGADCLVITTVVNGVTEGVTRAMPGDWLIKGVKGEVYPCKPDVFEATYETTDPHQKEAASKFRYE